MTIFLLKKLTVLKNVCDQCQCVSARLLSGLQLWNQEISSDLKHKIEDHWRGKLAQEPFDETQKHKEKYYVLSMFPYPSGYLHMGHVRVYTISDTVARFQRMNGKNVIHPIGWDAFGLPAENAAIDRQVAPEEWTRSNIMHMKAQLEELGCSFEWNRELATCDPEYYRWTQDLFLKLYDAGLAYQKQALVNWDPVDQTVLADEQVDENGCSWRSGAKVEKKLLRQWFVKTTRFAKDLYDGLNDPGLEDWRDITKLQKHWIGECNGVNFDFSIKNENSQNGEFVTLWTDKPEYLQHAKFVVVTENHILAKKEGMSNKNGTTTLNVQLKNPWNGEVLPVFVTDAFDFDPQTDCFLGIPGACEISANFAKAHSIPFCNLPATENKKVLQKIQEQVCRVAKSSGIGGYWSSSKLRDWLISRQRYWGTPIPIIHCENCGTVPVPRDKLPVKLPKISKLTQRGKSPLEDIEDWVNIECPKCKRRAKRETDTMDTFVDSSWYFLRYLDPKNCKEIFDRNKVFQGMPVDLYIGGKEHAVLHLYYARFISHFLHSLGLLPEREPFKRLLVQGMVMGRSFRVKGTGQYLPESQVKIIDLKKNKAVTKETNEPVVIQWEKMSKSKHNGVDPADMFKQYGTDSTRLLILADVAPTSHRNWNSNTFPGILNWQKRLWLTIQDFLKHRNNPPPMISEEEFKKHDEYMWDSRNYYIKGTTFNYVISQQLSIAVSKQQGLTNSIRRAPHAIFAFSPQFERALATQIILLAPMAPHFASELWAGFVSAPNRLITSEEIKWDKTVLEQTWPEVDIDYELDLACEINSHENCVIKFPRLELDNLTEKHATKIALDQKIIQEVLSSREIDHIEYKLYKGCKAVINIKTKFNSVSSNNLSASSDKNIAVDSA